MGGAHVQKGGGAIVQKGIKRGGASRVCPLPPKSATDIQLTSFLLLSVDVYLYVYLLYFNPNPSYTNL